MSMQISREQVEGFLDCVRSRASAFSDGDSLGSSVAANAELARTCAENSFSLSLTPDPPGVQLLDQLLDAMHRAKKPSALSRLFGHRVSREETGLVSATLGAFYGEAVRARIGGRWELAEFRGERFIALVTGYGKKFAILQKAGKQFECGHQDSVYFFYSFLSRPAERKGKFADLKPRERDRLRAEILERFEALSAERKRKAGKA